MIAISFVLSARASAEVARAARPGEARGRTLVRLLRALVRRPQPLLRALPPGPQSGRTESFKVDDALHQALLGLGGRSPEGGAVARALLEAWSDAQLEAQGRRLGARRARGHAVWSREKTLARMRALAREKGRTLSYTDLMEDGPVYEMALRHFGHLDLARAAAGLPRWPRPRRWTRAVVIAEVARAHREGIRLTFEGLNHAGLGDLAAALRLVGGLARARRLAGVPAPTRLRGEPEPWDAARVLDEIAVLQRSGEPLAASRVQGRLVNAGVRYFGSWRLAIEAAGLDYLSVCLKHPGRTEEELLELIRELARARPQLTLGEAERHSLAKSWTKRFGSIERAAARAKLSGWPVRQRFAPLDRKQTLAALKRRRREGKSLSHTRAQREDPRLVSGVRRHFPSWLDALRAAGLSTKELPRRWTPDAVVRALRALERAGKALPGAEWGLYLAARRIFGSLKAARVAAGLTNPQVQHWSVERVLTALRAHGPGQLPRGPLYYAAVKRFGSINAARARTGFPVLGRPG